MLVERFMIGNTTIEIYDDAYKDKTKEDIDKTLRRIEEIGRSTLYKQSIRAEAEEA